MASPKDIFLNGCVEIDNALSAHGFKSLQKGQMLKQPLSADKDITGEIHFQSSHLNSAGHIIVWPHISICSKQLKKWHQEQTGNPNATGVVYSNQLGFFTPRKQWTDWNLAGASYAQSVSDIAQAVHDYVLPVFELFADKSQAIAFLQANGTQFHPWLEKSLQPMAFMLCFAPTGAAQGFFDDFISHCTYQKRIRQLYQNLAQAQSIDLNYSEFIGACDVKLAYIHGLTVHNNAA